VISVRARAAPQASNISFGGQVSASPALVTPHLKANYRSYFFRKPRPLAVDPKRFDRSMANVRLSA
jgi:hypothetical protein